MSIDIKKITDEELEVNGKKVYKDSNDKWVGQHLNSVETRAVGLYLAALEKTSKNRA
jgi:hypothetical protein